jgi:hypothetical protein
VSARRSVTIASLDEAGGLSYDLRHWLPVLCPRDVGGERMSWETPAFVEVKMDAEINSYQDDFDRETDDRF